MLNNDKIKVSLLEGAKLPVRAHNTDSGYDVFANGFAFVKQSVLTDITEESVVIKPGQRLVVKTGVKVELPDDYEIQVRGRSGLARNFGIIAVFGTVDAGYRGEIQITLVNTSQEDYPVSLGDKVAQFVFAKVERPTLVQTEIDTLSERGAGGFGHTGY